MGWTEKPELSETDEIAAQLDKLPMRDHMTVVAVLSLSAAFKDKGQVEPSHFRDLSFALAKAIRHVSVCDALKFLMEQLKKAPEATTVQDVITIVAMIGLRSQQEAEKAAQDAQRLVALLPSQQEASSASK
jgi:hypothetical protein